MIVSVAVIARGDQSVGSVLGGMFAIGLFLGYWPVRSFFLGVALRLATGLESPSFGRSGSAAVAGLALALVCGGVGALLLVIVQFVHWGWLGWFERFVLLDGPVAGTTLGYWVFRGSAGRHGEESS